MKENSVIKLENNENYIILDKLHLDSNIYYFCSKTSNANEIIQYKITFFIEKKAGENIYLAEVKDTAILAKLIKIVKNLT